MDASGRQRWLSTAILVGVLYCAIGIASSALAGAAASNRMVTFWRLSAFVISAVVFAAHIAYEHFRLRNTARPTAWHASVAVAFGAFALAVMANIHDLGSASGYRPRMLIALVAFPLVTAVPAYFVALVVAAVLGVKRRGVALPVIGSLAVLPLAYAESQSARAAQVPERRIAPASANARVTQWTADHYVWLAPSANGAQIMLLLPGSNGKPANFRLIGSVAAQQGYRAIGLMYPDNLAVAQGCARDLDDACMARMRTEIIEGVSLSPHVNVDRDNSIDGRLADLLRYLAREYPSEGWESFLLADSMPRWDRIAVGGLSQGGGHAAFIAKLRSVPRVVMFGAPADGYRGEVALWMQIGATPAERYFGFRHERDPFKSISPNWHALGLEKFAGVKKVDETTTDFGGAHLFTTDLLPATKSDKQAHPSVFADGATPRRPWGTPVFDAVWRYLLGTP